MRAQADAIEWLNYRRQLGRDDSEPRGLCVSVTSESVCDRFADDDQAPIELTLVSVPLGAQVLVDGEAVGKTPMTHVLSVERHAIRMEKGEDFVEKQISVGVDEPIRYTWRAKDASWTPGY